MDETRPVNKRIRVVAPSGPVNAADLSGGERVLESRGFDVVEGEHTRDRFGYLAGTDEARIHDLQSALDEADTGILWFARGGYGVTRLLGRLSPGGLRKRPKILAGYSDATALFAWAQRLTGAACLYAPSVQELAGEDAFDMDALWAALMGHPRAIPGKGTSPAGPFPVVGGCLSLLSVLVGTPWEPLLDGRWLFIEDVGESLYRIDRMLVHLSHAGWFDRVAGVLLGGFTGLGKGERAEDVESLVRELIAPDKAIVAELPVGHLRGKYTLPFGLPAYWDGKKLAFPGWRNLPNGGVS